MDYHQLAEKFVKEMHAKYMRRVNKPGNTPQPWFDFSRELLLSRLLEEIDELREAVEKGMRRISVTSFWMWQTSACICGES